MTSLPTMAAPQSESVPQVTPLRNQHDLSRSSDFYLQRKNIDNSSPTSAMSLPPHLGALHARAQSSPTPDPRSLGKRARVEPPTTYHKRRPRLSGESRSAPDGIETTGAEPLFIQDPDLQKKTYTSPCGKEYKRLGKAKENHEATCIKCINEIANKPRAEANGETTMNTRRQGSPGSAKTNPIEIPDDQEVEAGSIPKPDSEPPKFASPGCEEDPFTSENESTHPANNSGPRKTNKAPNRRTLQSANRDPPISNGEDDLGIVSAEALGLEDYTIPGEIALPTLPAGHKLKAIDLHTKIRVRLERMLTIKDQEGFVYVFADPARPGLYKIGRTKNTEDRIRGLKYQCGLILDHISSESVNKYARAELLVHTYLLDLRETYKCRVCGTTHGEWFRIEKEHATAAVTLWTGFMNKETPYDLETRQLQPFISDLIKSRDHLLKAAGSTVEDARKHWNRNLSPTFSDHYQLKYSGIWGILWKFYWPINTMFAWTVAFAVSHHRVTFLLMAASVIGTFISISGENHRLHKSSLSSKRK